MNIREPFDTSIARYEWEMLNMLKNIISGSVSGWILLGGFLCPGAARGDTAYLSPDALEVEVDLEADVDSPSYEVGYITGIADAYEGKLICLFPRTTRGQLARIVEDYRKERLDRPVKTSREIVINALRTAFPCRRTK